MPKRSPIQMTRGVSPITRRQALGGIAAAALLGNAMPQAAQAADEQNGAAPRQINGRIKQSLVHWCYSKYFDVDKMCQLAARLGCRSVELIAVEHWQTLKKYGLSCAIASSHGFVQGMNNPKYQEKSLDILRTRIDNCADGGVPSVITFTGMCEDIPRDAGMDNCVNGYKKIIGYAEQKKVNLCLEMLNSRVNEFMKGHPGYMGDHTDWCIELIKKVGSERMKLLFDIYHVQIMDGDVISRIHQHKDYIGHVHTAGNPGRRELDDKQEINYKPIMQALIDVGYQGYVGQEFIPTRDPEQGLAEAVALCDV